MDGLSKGDSEVHHHPLWQVECPQLLQEMYPQLGFFLVKSWAMMVPIKWRLGGAAYIIYTLASNRIGSYDIVTVLRQITSL